MITEICQLCGDPVIGTPCTGNKIDGYVHNDCLDDYNEDTPDND